LIPKQKGCYYDSEHYIFSVDNNIQTIVAGSGAVDVSNVQRTIKEYLYTKGPAVGGFIIFANFTSKVQSGMHKGNSVFNLINGGVYLEKANYSTYRGAMGEEITEGLTFSSSNTESENVLGGHAIAIMGWGVQPHIRVGNGPNDFADVPYWYCRNSWGTKWGMNGGYFKIAMYPYNRKSQFSKIVDIMTPDGRRMRLGGVLAVTVSKAPELSKLPSNPQPPMLGSLNRDMAFYKADEDEVVAKSPEIVPPVKHGEGTEGGSSDNWNIYALLILFVVIVLFVLIRRQ
jgi:hypothetical protein